MSTPDPNHLSRTHCPSTSTSDPYQLLPFSSSRRPGSSNQYIPLFSSSLDMANAYHQIPFTSTNQPMDIPSSHDQSFVFQSSEISDISDHEDEISSLCSTVDTL